MEILHAMELEMLAMIPTASNYVKFYIENINPKNPHTPSAAGTATTAPATDAEVTEDVVSDN